MQGEAKYRFFAKVDHATKFARKNGMIEYNSVVSFTFHACDSRSPNSTFVTTKNGPKCYQIEILSEWNGNFLFEFAIFGFRLLGCVPVFALFFDVARGRFRCQAEVGCETSESAGAS